MREIVKKIESPDSKYLKTNHTRDPILSPFDVTWWFHVMQYVEQVSWSLFEDYSRVKWGTKFEREKKMSTLFQFSRQHLYMKV